tara:strand:- start:401 stop:544 length:144 start_codon:yes stop_codon:yes gene_type:complete
MKTNTEFICNNSKIKDLEHKIKLLELENKSLKQQLEFYLQRITPKNY